jgi:hypothetical protein
VRPAQDGAHHPALQPPPHEGAEPVAIEQLLARHRPRRRRVDQRDVGVGGHGQPALGRGQAEAARRRRREQLGEPRRRQAAAHDALVVEQRQQRLGTGDPAPDREEVVALLQRGRGGRVVGGDEVDVPGLQRRPQRVAFPAGRSGGAHLATAPRRSASSESSTR